MRARGVGVNRCCENRREDEAFFWDYRQHSLPNTKNGLNIVDRTISQVSIHSLVYVFLYTNTELQAYGLCETSGFRSCTSKGLQFVEKPQPLKALKPLNPKAVKP